MAGFPSAGSSPSKWSDDQGASHIGRLGIAPKPQPAAVPLGCGPAVHCNCSSRHAPGSSISATMDLRDTRTGASSCMGHGRQAFAIRPAVRHAMEWKRRTIERALVRCRVATLPQKADTTAKAPIPVSFGVAFKEGSAFHRVDGTRIGHLRFGIGFRKPETQSPCRIVNWPVKLAADALTLGAGTHNMDPAGLTPQSPSGEEWADDANGGSRLDVAVSVGFSPARAARQKSQPAFRGALTLHHLSQGTAPHLSPIPLDSVRWRPSWWLEGQGEMGWENLQWRAWHRGTLQGSSHLLELGLTMGRSFGTSARFTKTRLSHHVETGVPLAQRWGFAADFRMGTPRASLEYGPRLVCWSHMAGQRLVGVSGCHGPPTSRAHSHFIAELSLQIKGGCLPHGNTPLGKASFAVKLILCRRTG